MEAILDFGIAAFIPVVTFIGYRRGGIISICNFLTVFIAFFGAVIISNNFCGPVGRLVQPVLKEVLTTELEKKLAYEDILIEVPMEELSNDLKDSLTGEESGVQEVITLERALMVLTSSTNLQYLEGFIAQANKSLWAEAAKYTGSVTELISTVVGREVARVGIFIVSFLVLMAVWLLGTKAIKIAFKMPGLARINAMTGAAMGLLTAVLLVHIFAWITSGGIISEEETKRTVLYEFFAKNALLDSFTTVKNYDLDL